MPLSIRARGPHTVTAVKDIQEGALAMDDGICLAEKLLGMPGLAVLDAEDVPGEVVIQAEVTRSNATCPTCRRAQAHDRVETCGPKDASRRPGSRSWRVSPHAKDQPIVPVPR